MVHVDEIRKYLCEMGLEVCYYGKEDLQISGFSSISDLKNGTVTWLRRYDKSYTEALQSCDELLLVTTQEACEQLKGLNILVTDRPKMCFFEIVKQFFTGKKEGKISACAVIKTDRIGKNVTIGDYCSIGEDVVIGDNVVIKNHVQIEGPVVIEDNCTISSGVVIGSDGFGYYRDIDGNNTQVPHAGGVHIGRNVDIGANTCIDRGTIANTVIGAYTKIDNLCHIGHNVKIGRNVFIIALSMIGGSAILEDETYVAPGAKIMNQIHVGKNAFVGMGAVVIKDVGENDVVTGVPAQVIRKRREDDRE